MDRLREAVLVIGAIVIVSGVGGYDVRAAAIVAGAMLVGAALVGMILEAKDAV